MSSQRVSTHISLYIHSCGQEGSPEHFTGNGTCCSASSFFKTSSGAGRYLHYFSQDLCQEQQQAFFIIAHPKLGWEKFAKQKRHRHRLSQVGEDTDRRNVFI